MRMASIHSAAMTGLPAASGVLNIMKNGKVASGDMGIAISTPVYRVDRSVNGYMTAVIDLPTLFQQATQRADGAKLDMLVYDLHSGDSKPIYTWLGDATDLTAAMATSRSLGPLDQATTVDFARQAWEIVLHPRPSFEAAPLLRHSAGVTAAGLLMTLLLLLAIARVQGSRRATEQAQRQTQLAKESLTAQSQRLHDVIIRPVLQRLIKWRGNKVAQAHHAFQFFIIVQNVEIVHKLIFFGFFGCAQMGECLLDVKITWNPGKLGGHDAAGAVFWE